MALWGENDTDPMLPKDELLCSMASSEACSEEWLLANEEGGSAVGRCSATGSCCATRSCCPCCTACGPTGSGFCFGTLTTLALLGFLGVWLAQGGDARPASVPSRSMPALERDFNKSGREHRALIGEDPDEAFSPPRGLLASVEAWGEHRLDAARHWAKPRVAAAERWAEPRIDAAAHWDGWNKVIPSLGTTSTTTTTTTKTVVVTSSTSTSSTTSKTHTTTITTTTTSSLACSTPQEGDDCYDEVIGVMYDIQARPEKFHLLNLWSSFEEVQNYLHARKGDTSTCAPACTCRTARPGSDCYQSVMYAMNTGIHAHPDWYKGMGEQSSFEEFQAYLWKYSKDAKCGKPCRPSWRGSPSLFCWSVTQRSGYEAAVMKAQLNSGAGIFACDGFAVVSEEEWTVGYGPGGRIGVVKTVTFQGADVGVSKDGTAGNAKLFMNAWDALLQKTDALDFDWIFKVDPDAVVLADRLRSHVAGKTGAATYVRNCNKVPDSPDFPMMYGSLEAISREGLHTYRDNKELCKKELDWAAWGEDYYLGKCFLHLDVAPTDDFSLISDGVCTGVDCSSADSAAFHPFKDPEKWLNCWRTATSGQVGVPLALP